MGGGVSSGHAIGASPRDDPDPHRSRYLALFEHALTTSLQALAAEARLRLAYYYVQGLTLAEIDRLVGESEATMSRKLARARRGVHADVERMLSTEHRLTPSEIGLFFEYALGEWPFDLSQVVSETPRNPRSAAGTARTAGPPARNPGGAVLTEEEEE